MPNPNAQKTRCPYGHPYDEANTILMKVKDRHGNYTGKVKRQCRTCKKEGKRGDPGKEKGRPEAAQV